MQRYKSQWSAVITCCNCTLVIWHPLTPSGGLRSKTQWLHQRLQVWDCSVKLRISKEINSQEVGMIGSFIEMFCGEKQQVNTYEHLNVPRQLLLLFFICPWKWLLCPFLLHLAFFLLFLIFCLFLCFCSSFSTSSFPLAFCQLWMWSMMKLLHMTENTFLMFPSCSCGL